jgi:hypothetical protein
VTKLLRSTCVCLDSICDIFHKSIYLLFLFYFVGESPLHNQQTGKIWNNLSLYVCIYKNLKIDRAVIGALTLHSWRFTNLDYSKVSKTLSFLKSDQAPIHKYNMLELYGRIFHIIANGHVNLIKIEWNEMSKYALIVHQLIVYIYHRK